MFGYITPDQSQMDEAQFLRYGGCYCGLCRTLQKRHGLLGRMTLTYDMTFLVLILSSLYEPEERSGMARCPVHPLKKRSYWSSEFSDYAADLNVLLAWWNCLDDWEDERKLSRLLLYKCLSGRCRKLEQKYPGSPVQFGKISRNFTGMKPARRSVQTGQRTASAI